MLSPSVFSSLITPELLGISWASWLVYHWDIILTKRIVSPFGQGAGVQFLKGDIMGEVILRGQLEKYSLSSTTDRECPLIVRLAQQLSMLGNLPNVCSEIRDCHANYLCPGLYLAKAD